MSAVPQLLVDPPRVVAPTVDIVLPVHNEAHVLEASVVRVHRYLADHLAVPWRVTVVDNASTDATLAVARSLAGRLAGVDAIHLARKGRGHALRTAWSTSDAAVVAYMDIDLSTDLDALLPLLAPLLSGHSDIAIGSRLAPGAAVTRGAKREVISRSYNRMLRTLFGVGFRDAQCGFKALRTEAAVALLPAVADDGWFFDTELLLLAEHNGLRIHEVPVTWVDDPDTRVRIVRTAAADLRGVVRMVGRFVRGQGHVALPRATRATLVRTHRLRSLTRWTATVGVGLAVAALVATLHA